ncbi:hypothetical protein NFJ02_03g100140 [Pycnococcus provasolii]
MASSYTPMAYVDVPVEAPGTGTGSSGKEAMDRRLNPTAYKPTFYPPKPRPASASAAASAAKRTLTAGVKQARKGAPPKTAPPPALRPSTYATAAETQNVVPRDSRGRALASKQQSIDTLEAEFTRIAGAGPNTGLWSRGGLAQRRLQLEAAVDMAKRDLAVAATAKPGDAAAFAAGSPAALAEALRRVEEEHARLRAANRRLESRIADQSKELRKHAALMRGDVAHAVLPRDDDLERAAAAAAARRRALASAPAPRQTSTSEGRRRRAEALHGAVRRMSTRAHGSSRAAEAVADAVAEMLTDAAAPVAQAQAAEEQARAALENLEARRDAAFAAGAAQLEAPPREAAPSTPPSKASPDAASARTPSTERKRRTWNERWQAPSGGAEARAAKAALALAARARLRGSPAPASTAAAATPTSRRRPSATAMPMPRASQFGDTGRSVSVTAAHAADRRRFAQGVEAFEEELALMAREEERLRKLVLQSVSSSSSSAKFAIPRSTGGKSLALTSSISPAASMQQYDIPQPPAGSCVSPTLVSRIRSHRDARVRRRAAMEGGVVAADGADTVVQAVAELILDDVFHSTAEELGRHCDAVGDHLVSSEFA